MTQSTMHVFEKYGLTGELIFENALQRLLNGKATIDEALDYIMEFARGHWSLIIDENLKSLADALAALNYDAEVVPKGMSDDEIRRTFAGEGVFVTSNDRDFRLTEVPQPFRKGMILVPNGVDDQRLAREIERVGGRCIGRHPCDTRLSAARFKSPCAIFTRRTKSAGTR